MNLDDEIDGIGYGGKCDGSWRRLSAINQLSQTPTSITDDRDLHQPCPLRLHPPSLLSSLVFACVCPIVRQVHPRGFPDADASVAPASRLTKLQKVSQIQSTSCLPL